MSKRIDDIEVHAARLEIPVRDFERLPRALGCSLLRSKRALTLSSNGGCELGFQVAGETAVLFHVGLEGDDRARFFDHVLGVLIARFHGELHATVASGEERTRVLVGATPARHAARHPQEHPASPADQLALVERHLDDARSAWLAYQQSKPRT